MQSFFLTRITIPQTSQLPVFGSSNADVPEAEILRKIISQKPTLELRKGQMWHIGNLFDVDNMSMYFAIGRAAKSKMPKLDMGSGDFIEENSDIAPFTYAVIDLKFQLVAIWHRSILAPTPSALASRLERLVNSSPILSEYGRSCEIRIISDPADFIATIVSSYRIYSLSVEFGRPNPWDAEEQFQRPMQKLIKDADAKEGVLTIRGDDLKRDVAEGLARKTSAVGRDAKMRYQSRRRARASIKHLKGDTAKVQTDDTSTPEGKTRLVEAVREEYLSIRDKRD